MNFDFAPIRLAVLLAFLAASMAGGAKSEKTYRPSYGKVQAIEKPIGSKNRDTGRPSFVPRKAA